MSLYHYTCSHGIAGIGAFGKLLPRTCPWMPDAPAVVWLTDMVEPDRDAIGLTSTILTCDRLEGRYVVSRNAPGVFDWASFAAAHVGDTAARRTAERYADPSRWWVSTTPISARRDLSYRRPPLHS